MSLQYNDKVMIYEQKKNTRQIRWLMFWVIVSLYTISLVTDAVFSFFETSHLTYIIYVKMLIKQVLAILLPMLIFFRVGEINLQKSSKINLRLNKFTFVQALMVMILAMCGYFITMTLNAPFAIIQESFFSNNLPPVGIFTGNDSDIPLAIISLAIVPAILEEVLMRGVVFGVTERQSTMFAAIFTTFVFAILHSDIFGILGFIFLGIMLIFVMLRTNSLYAAIFYHFIHNFTAFMFEYLLRKEIIKVNPLIVWIFISAIVVFIVAMFIFRLITPSAPKNKVKDTLALVVENIFSIPIILCIIVAVVVQYFNLFGGI